MTITEVATPLDEHLHNSREPERCIVTEPGVYDLTEAAEVCRVPVGPDHSAIIDVADYPLVSVYTWRPLFGQNGKIYAQASSTIYMHRLVAETPRNFDTDHINNNGLDNRRCNLRTATRSQNCANRQKLRQLNGRPTGSKYKGVSWDKSRNKWQSKIHVRGLHRNLGRYASEEAAARAYDVAALAAWGEFAVLNFPVQAVNQ